MSATPPNVPRHLAQAELTVDLGALAANWRALRARAGPAECSAVVKADAYGVGLAEVAPALAASGCRTFFVAHASEGLRLRALLPASERRIYVLNGLAGGGAALADLLAADVRPVICSLAELELYLQHCGGPAGAPGVGIQFSTGMNRLGFAPAEAGALAARLDGLDRVPVDFIMSHFISSEIPDDPLNDAQIALFEDIRRQFPGLPASLANSSGMFLPQAPCYDLTRPGYAIYGGNPCPGAANPMLPVVRLEAPILQVRDVAAGESAGYNATWTAMRPSRLAIIGVGYADGVPRSSAAASGKVAGLAMIGGVACPFAGRVSMDLIVLDVTDAPTDAVHPGARAQLLGPDISIDDLAERAGTIGYEILTSLGRRYHRVYLPA